MPLVRFNEKINNEQIRELYGCDPGPAKMAFAIFTALAIIAILGLAGKMHTPTIGWVTLGLAGSLFVPIMIYKLKERNWSYLLIVGSLFGSIMVMGALGGAHILTAHKLGTAVLSLALGGGFVAMISKACFKGFQQEVKAPRARTSSYDDWD